MGFLSLAEEILWVRIFSFFTYGVPQAFSFVLSFFLLGVGVGALFGRRMCSSDSVETLKRSFVVVIIGALLTMSVPWLLIKVAGGNYVLPFVAALITLSAALKSAIFPVVHHLGSVLSSQLGRSLSKVYFLNILGSAAGPVLVGFFLLNYFSSQSLFVLFGCLGFLVLCYISVWINKALSVAAIFFFSLSFLVFFKGQDHSLLEAYAQVNEGESLKSLIEGRSGVVHTTINDKGLETVYGGNVYDGKLNVDIRGNENLIDRVYLLSALTEKVEDVLVIGLSGGSWVRVISSFPGVKNIDVIEINSDYLRVVEGNSVVSPILKDSRIHFYFDDGRRWLRRNPEKKYDLIVMNTTYHWRTYSSNLLSHEFLSLAHGRLNERGILAYNATGSQDAFRTAVEVFPHAYRWSNFIYAANYDFRKFDAAFAKERLMNLSLPNGEVLLDYSDAKSERAVNVMLGKEFVTLDVAAQDLNRPLEIVTDDNMITEFRFGLGL
ncbi:fused MFS/spermidine synthase [Pseudomonas sp. LRF_L74]|uniref:fused MFS/spermidine synthase n=1 Tax=Pseudomonas sp. LRF_L74 TaxID=3369422 RepID=UPI003F5DC621